MLEGDNAVFPQDFLEAERTALRQFITKSLDTFEEEAEEDGMSSGSY
jgi:hypothetical protein